MKPNLESVHKELFFSRSRTVLRIVGLGAVLGWLPFHLGAQTAPLLNVNFAAYDRVKVGFAATGQTTNDFWNNYTAPFQAFAGLSNLKLADGTVTAVGLTVQNGAGHTAFSHPDLMYQCCCYAQDLGDITLTVTNLPSGQYDFYVYGHAGDSTANSIFQMLVGGVDFGNKSTATDSSWSLTNWVEGAQYVVYRSVQVTNAGAPLIIKSHPGRNGYTYLNGLQVVGVVVSNCTDAPSGLVSWWKAESNALDAAGSNNGTLIGNTTYGAGRVGQAFVFDGSGDAVSVGNPANLQLQDFTIEAWVKRGSSSVASLTPWQSGGVFDYAWGGYGFGLWDDGRPFLTKVGYDNISPTFAITDTNTFHHVAVTKTGSTVVFYLDGVAQTVGPYNSVFEFNGPAAIGARGGDYDSSFLGSIDELSIYNHALSPAEIQGVHNAGASGKCLTPSAPFIASQPQNQTVIIGANANFSVAAAGTPPLSYQWFFNGSNLVAGATESFLTISNAQIANAGLYSVLVSYGISSVLSSNALLTVNPGPTVLQAANVSAASGGPVTVPVVLNANGAENALSFSLSWTTSRLAYASSILAATGTGATLFINDSQSSLGLLGVLIALPAGATFPPGSHELVEVTFTAAIESNATSTAIAFGDHPIVRQVSDAVGNDVVATYLDGNVSIAAQSFESDVSPRPNGDQAVTVRDLVLIGRFVAHLDTPANGSEFQRADCAPRASLGDGRLSITDWVQAGRYAAGLDPLTPAGGPTAQVSVVSIALKSIGPKLPNSRQILAGSTVLNQGQSGTVSINLHAAGNENALGFTLAFDPTQLAYVDAQPGAAAAGATLNVNTDQAGSGLLGFALALSGGSHFGGGSNELVKVKFQASLSSTNSLALSFVDDVIYREVSDITANELTADYVNGTIVVNPLPALRIWADDQGIGLAWPSWATNFVLQENATDLASPGSWTNVPVSTITTNNEKLVIVPIDRTARFYRLQK